MNLNEIAEISYEQIFPNGGDETAIDISDFERTAFMEFAYQSLLMFWKEKNDEGYAEVPSYLLSEVEKEVINNEIDISDLKTFKSLPQDIWLQNIGGINCQCKYVKSTANLSQLLCDEDCLADTDKTYYIAGKKIKFPNGTHAPKLTILYASMDGVNGDIEVTESIAAIIREKLNAIYFNKTGQEDVTNNSNSLN